MRETFTLEPFPCPECGHFLLVDGIRDGGHPDHFEVKEIIDHTRYTDPDPLGHWYGEYRSMGWHQMYKEIIRLKREIASLQPAKSHWYSWR